MTAVIEGPMKKEKSGDGTIEEETKGVIEHKI